MARMKLIVWLGNPWVKYEKTRHNIGFHFLDLRAEQQGFSPRKYEGKYKSDLISAVYDGQKILLCKPQTYMNLSGEAVAPLARFYKVDPEEILVLHDEIDFVTARLALKQGGSAAGHNGLKSLIEKLGSREFWRLRIGVDRPAVATQVADRVLSSFKPQEKQQLDEKSDEIFGLIADFLQK